MDFKPFLAMDADPLDTAIAQAQAALREWESHYKTRKDEWDPMLRQNRAPGDPAWKAWRAKQDQLERNLKAMSDKVRSLGGKITAQGASR